MCIHDVQIYHPAHRKRAMLQMTFALFRCDLTSLILYEGCPSVGRSVQIEGFWQSQRTTGDLGGLGASKCFRESRRASPSLRRSNWGPSVGPEGLGRPKRPIHRESWTDVFLRSAALR